MAAAVFEVEGLREFQRNLNKIDKGTARAINKGIRKAAKPVAKRVETLALEKISRIGPEWNRMRLGGGMQIYIAPKMRNRGGSPRPNLSGLLMNEAMIPAVGEKRKQFLKDVGDEFDKLAATADF